MVAAGTKPSAPVSVEPHEQAGAGDAGDAGGELGADAVGEIGGDQPVGGLALGRHGAALGVGDRLGDVGEAARVLASRQAAGAEAAARGSARGARSRSA